MRGQIGEEQAEFASEVGARVRRIRADRKLSQMCLANRIGMALQGPLSDIERGRHLPSVATLMAICRELACTPNDILQPGGATHG